MGEPHRTASILLGASIRLDGRPFGECATRRRAPIPYLALRAKARAPLAERREDSAPQYHHSPKGKSQGMTRNDVLRTTVKDLTASRFWQKTRLSTK